MSSKLIKVLSVVFAISLLVFGLNKFIFFIPSPPLPGSAGELMKIYVDSGFMKIIGLFEIIIGISLIVNKFIPLSLTFLAAIIFNALIFHLLHHPAGIANAVFATVVVMLLVYHHRSKFSTLLSK